MNLPLLSIGLDLEDLRRWRQDDLRVLAPDSRIFSAGERAACDRHADPIPHYAARWCAKEAVVKAMAPLCRLHVTQVEIVSAPDRAPEVAWLGIVPPPALLALSLSLTHSQTTAAAVAVAQYLAGAKPPPTVK